MTNPFNDQPDYGTEDPETAGIDPKVHNYLWPNGYGEFSAPSRVRADVDGNGQAWLTKDSGKRAEFAGGGIRDTEEGKPRFDLLLPETVPYEDQLLTRFAALMGRGAEKYEDRNWEQFSDEKALQRARSSAFRHFMQWFNGETDEDHAAAVLFNIMAAEYVRGVLDGRWPSRTIRFVQDSAKCLSDKLKKLKGLP